MGFFELFLLSVGLAMDAFSVSICKGLNMQKLHFRHVCLIAAFFGGFQAGMPLIGWMLGKQFEKSITSVDHWIAFILLGIIGGKMIWEALKGGEEDEDCGGIKLGELFILAVATSIDALAVGITFAFLQVHIFFAVALIGIITFLLSAVGVVIGKKFGSQYRNKAELAGGIILVLLGTKILLEHLGILSLT
ncbi:manganese efflux pump MntP family protein [Anaerolentibacter hominis]|uniref:manganese efflux pump MntP n=1 Tax=Anaerolentibacter hominis TaxID=3079009 RepID=UPI0031B807D3